MRTKNPITVRKVMDQYANTTLGFIPEVWLADDNNLAFTNEYGDISLFQYERPGVYFAHSYFNSRGKQAMKVAEEFLSELFEKYPTKAIQGITPVERKASRWFNRQIGLKSYGIIETNEGPCELFILTKEEYNGYLRRQ